MQEDNNGFFFEKCVYATLDAKILNDVETNGCGIVSFADKTCWVPVADALFEAKESRRALTILLSDATDSLNVKWVAIVDAIDLMEEGATIAFGFAEELELPMPVAMMPIFGTDHVLGDGFTGTCAICETPEFINDYLEWVLGTENAVDAFKHALLVAKVTEKQRAMLNHHYQAPEHAITMSTLARLMGYANFNAANLQYGKFAGRMAALLDHPIEPDSDNLISIAFPSDTRHENGHFQWEMRSELAQALEELGWVEVKRVLH